MNIFKELIEDNKYMYKKYGFTHLITIWIKLIGYLIIIPSINLFFLWKVWWFGILMMPLTYVCYIIALQGYTGIQKLLFDVLEGYNWIKGIFKRK